MEVLIPTPLPPTARANLTKLFTVYAPADGEDLDALIARVGPKVRAIACGPGIVTGGGRLRLDDAFLSRFPKLEMVANLGVGYENIDAVAAARRGVVVSNTPDVLTDEVADLAMGLLIATVREIPQADRWLRAGRWREAPFRLTTSLRGRSLGILGLGRIGAAIAVRAAAFGLRILYHNRRARTDVPWAYAASPLELARACDILMIAAPGGEQTRRLVDRAVLDALGPDGIVVNIARGSLVDESALIDALREGAILAAGLDVFANEPHPPSELIALDNVVLLPHVGSGSRKTREDMALLMVDNLASWAAGRGPLTPVAETPWPRTGSEKVV